MKKKKIIITSIILLTVGVVGYLLYHFIFNKPVPGSKGVTLLELKRYLMQWERNRLKEQFSGLEKEIGGNDTDTLGIPNNWDKWLKDWVKKEVLKGKTVKDSLKSIYDYMDNMVTFDDVLAKSREYKDVYRQAILTHPQITHPDETLEYLALKWGYAV